MKKKLSIWFDIIWGILIVIFIVFFHYNDMIDTEFIYLGLATALFLFIKTIYRLVKRKKEE